MIVKVPEQCPKCGKPTKVIRGYFLQVVCSDWTCTYIQSVLSLGLKQQDEGAIKDGG